MTDPSSLAGLGQVTLLYEESDVNAKIAQLLRDTWRDQLGLVVTLKGVTGEEVQRDVASGEFAIAMVTLKSDRNDAMGLLRQWASGSKEGEFFYSHCLLYTSHTVSEKASGKRSVFMIYHSTRDEKLTAAPARAVLEGIAPDGGLYVCDPGKLEFDWQGALQKDTMSMAADILGVLLPDFQDMNGLVRASYAGKFASDDLTPLVPVGERYVLELYHGPTSAFKDVALSVLPRLVSAAAKQEGAGDVVILTATSGDTGKAALEGFHDVRCV